MSIESAARQAAARKRNAAGGESHDSAKMRPSMFHIVANPNIKFSTMDKWPASMFRMFLRANRAFCDELRRADKLNLIEDPNGTKPTVSLFKAKLEKGGQGKMNYHLDITLETSHFAKLSHSGISALYRKFMSPFSGGSYVNITYVANYAANVAAYSDKYPDSLEM